MARFYTNENIALHTVMELRRLGHDVMTSRDAGKANASVPDLEVLAFAATNGRILVSHNRKHFPRLHQRRASPHAGIVVCTFDPDFAGLALRVHDAVNPLGDSADWLLRVNRPG